MLMAWAATTEHQGSRPYRHTDTKCRRQAPTTCNILSPERYLSDENSWEKTAYQFVM